MAEAWSKELSGDRFEAFSAGVEPGKLDPRAVKAMAEAGLDISGQRPKHTDSLGDLAFDFVITLCRNAAETCPYFPARTRIMHQGFDDPPKLAEQAESEEEVMAHYRRVRDEIKAFVKKLPEILLEEGWKNLTGCELEQSHPERGCKQNMEVELLFAPGCSALAETEEMVKRLLEELAPQAGLTVKEVGSQRKAEALKFPGSPTVRVNGKDIEPDAGLHSHFGLGWRMYAREGGRPSKTPPEDLVRNFLISEKASES
jgi:arsenate reductase